MGTRRRHLFVTVLGAAVVLLLAAAIIVPRWLDDRRQDKVVDQLASQKFMLCLDQATTDAERDTCYATFQRDLGR